MKHSKFWPLKSLLLLLFLPLVLAGLVILPWGVSTSLEHQFQLRSQTLIDETLDELSSNLETLYVMSGGWNIQELRRLRFLSLPDVVTGLQILDRQDRVIWSHPVSHRNRRQIHMHSGRETMPVESLRPLKNDATPVGTLKVLSRPFIESHDGLFVKYFNRYMFLAALVVSCFTGGASLWIAQRLSRPIGQVSRRAVELSRGKYTGRSLPRTSILEVNELSESMEHLATCLEGQSQLRKRLLSDMTHELRTPVSIVKGHLEAFQDGVWPVSAERLALTVNEIDRLAQLIEDLEKISALEDLEPQLQLEKTDVSQLVNETIGSFTPLFSQKSVHLSGTTGHPLHVDIDPPRLRQAVSNLLSNALRYTPAGGSVTVTLVTKADRWLLHVSDTGMGVAPEDLPWIFERLYRSDQSRNRHEGGQGIGLALVKALVEAQGGSVSVLSTPGKGSTFTLSFPLN